jgi:hypothetical protein
MFHGYQYCQIDVNTSGEDRDGNRLFQSRR